MKLIMENWKNYLNEDEEEMRIQILKYLDENNIVLTEAELKEAMPRWLRKIGAGAALAGTLAATAPSAAAGDWEWGPGRGADADAAAQQAEVEADFSEKSDFSKNYGNNATGKISDNGDGTYNVKANSGKILPGSDTWMERAGKLSSEGVAKQLIRDFSEKKPELNLGTDWEFEKDTTEYSKLTGDIGNKHIVFTGKLVPKTK